MAEILLEHWRLGAAAASFALFWTWESFAPFFAFERRGRHATRNLAVAGLNLLLTALLFGGATVAAAVHAEQNGAGLLHQANIGAPWRFAAALVALDCWSYWWHRANHWAPLLWRFHRMHHSDPAMDVSTATRFHAGEIAMSFGLRLGLILALGLPVAAIVTYDFVLLVSTQFHHSNISLPAGLDRLVRLAVVSPNMHKVHHSQRRAEMDSNYASVLSTWDRLFGTFQPLEDCSGIEFGTPGLSGEERQTIKGMLGTPFARAGREMPR